MFSFSLTFQIPGGCFIQSMSGHCYTDTVTAFCNTRCVTYTDSGTDRTIF